MSCWSEVNGVFKIKDNITITEERNELLKHCFGSVWGYHYLNGELKRYEFKSSLNIKAPCGTEGSVSFFIEAKEENYIVVMIGNLRDVDLDDFEEKFSSYLIELSNTLVDNDFVIDDFTIINDCSHGIGAIVKEDETVKFFTTKGY